MDAEKLYNATKHLMDFTISKIPVVGDIHNVVKMGYNTYKSVECRLEGNKSGAEKYELKVYEGIKDMAMGKNPAASAIKDIKEVGMIIKEFWDAYRDTEVEELEQSIEDEKPEIEPSEREETHPSLSRPLSGTDPPSKLPPINYEDYIEPEIEAIDKKLNDIGEQPRQKHEKLQ